MTTQVIGVVPTEPVPVVGYRAQCDVWAQDEGGLVLVSFLGAHTVLQSLWAQLSAGHTVELADGALLYRQNQVVEAGDEEAENTTKTRYFRSVVRFAQIAQAHLVMVVEQATLLVRSGQRGYLLADSPEGEPGRFFALWNRTIPLPARTSWASYLWQQGLRRGAIRPITAYGCHAWAIEPEPAAWQEIIRWGIEDGTLS